MNSLVNKLIITTVLILAINMLFLVVFNVPVGWYMLPVSACGIVSSYQIIRIFYICRLNGLRLPLVFYFYCTLFFGCYLAPLTHFATNFWLIFNNSLVLPENWEPYVLIIGVLNAVGLGLFTLCYQFFYQTSKPYNRVYLLLQSIKLNYVYVIAGISFIFQLFIYSRLGGITGFIETYESRGDGEGFAGFGLLFIISEFFPIALMFLFYIKAVRNEVWRRPVIIFSFLLILFITCMFFGGLRGSRSNTILTLLHAGMLIHFFIRRFHVKEMVVGLLFLVCFMYVYKFYKQGGAEAVTQYSEGTLDASEDKYNFNVMEMLLTDFARGDIQPYLIYKYQDNKYEPKMGETYIGGLMHFLPGFIIDKEQLTTKKTAATELLYGHNGQAMGFYTTRIFGLLGEYILNFGYYTAFLIYLPLAFFIAKLDKWVYSLSPADVRNFIVPLWILFVIFLFSADLDNTIFFFMKRMLLVIVMLSLVSSKYIVKPTQ